MLNKGLKLNLGCGKKKIHGYINVDAIEGADVVDDCAKLSKFNDNSATVIYSSHLIEHFKHREVGNVLKRWYDVLGPGGMLRVATPDFRAIVECYLFHGEMSPFLHLLYGDQKDEYNNHYVLFDENYLTELLKEVGFKSVARYDWRETDHSFIDDYSQSYYPSIDYKTRRVGGEIKGKLVSLNLEAIK